MNSHFSKTLSTIYGRNFNPQRFESGQKRRRGAYFWALIFLFLAIAGVLAFIIYLFIGNPEGFSGEKVELKLLGNFNPATAGPMEYILNIRNNEDGDIIDLEIFLGLSASAPGARVEITEAGGSAAGKEQNTWTIAGLDKGEENNFNFTALFFGKPGEKIALPVKLSFRASGLNTIFVKEITQEFILGEAEFEFSLSAPTTASVGSEIALSLSINPELKDSYGQAWLEFNYPKEFTVISEEPKKENNGWQISVLPTIEDKLVVLIRGRLDGSPGREIKFVANLFTSQGGSSLAASEKIIKLGNSSLQLSLAVTPASGQKLQWNERADYRVTIKNLSSRPARDLVVSVSVSGEELIRPGSISALGGGFFESGNVIWDKESTPSLAELSGGGAINLNFSLQTLSDVPPNFSGTPAILTKARIRGSLGQEDSLAESGEVIAKILANVELNSLLKAKSGPNPPLPGQKTVYTVSWQIGPTNGALRDLEIRAKLPAASGWANETDLQVGEVTFDSGSRTVIWRSSRVPRLNEPVLVSFDVNFVSESEISNDLVVLEQSNFSAVDDAAGEKMELINFPLTLGAVKSL